MIALFVLLGVLTFTLALYSRSLGHLSQVDRNVTAANFADNVLSEMRNWASDPENFEKDEWAPFKSFTDPDFPGFKARVTVRFANILVPCTSQERERPIDRQVAMNATVKVADLQVLYDDQALFSVTTRLGEPRLVVAAIEPVVVSPVSPPPSQLAPDGTQIYTARLLDESGDEIDDVKFSWSVQPLTGNATITSQDRDGARATLTNVYIVLPGDRRYLGGNCQVIATASYFGNEYRGLSAPIELGRP